MRDLLLLLLVMRRRQRRQNRRQRRVWAHETLQTRDDRGEFHTLVRELHNYDDRFFEYFRMSQAQFAHILSILKPSITKQTTKFRQPIGCPEKPPCGRARTSSHAPLRLESNSDILLFGVLDTRHCRQAPSPAVAWQQQNKSADWSRARLASGIPLGNRSRSDRARYRSGVTRRRK